MSKPRKAKRTSYKPITSAQRAAEKQRSRDEDAAAIASGAKTQAQLREENSHFRHLAHDPINWDKTQVDGVAKSGDHVLVTHQLDPRLNGTFVLGEVSVHKQTKHGLVPVARKRAPGGGRKPRSNEAATRTIAIRLTKDEYSNLMSWRGAKPASLLIREAIEHLVASPPKPPSGDPSEDLCACSHPRSWHTHKRKRSCTVCECSSFTIALAWRK